MSDAHGGGGHAPAKAASSHSGGGSFTLDLPVGATWIVLGLAVVTLLVINYQFLQAYPTIASKVVFVEQTFVFYVIPFWVFRPLLMVPVTDTKTRRQIRALALVVATWCVGYGMVHTYVFLWAKQGLRLHERWGEIYALAGQALLVSFVAFVALNYVHGQLEQLVITVVMWIWRKLHSGPTKGPAAEEPKPDDTPAGAAPAHP